MADVVLLDTDVWSCVILAARDRDPRVAQWRLLLLGKDIAIAAQTEGEVRFGALVRKWGDTRISALEATLRATATLPVTSPVVRSFAAVRAACKLSGHPLAEKIHMGDAWIAATALAYDLPLLSGDEMFDGVPDLQFLKGSDG